MSEAEAMYNLQKALHLEAKEFREYLQNSMLHVEWMAAALVFGCGVIFTLLNYKSGKDIRAQVNERFRTTYDTAISDRLKAADTLIDDNKRRIDEYAKKTEKLALDQFNLTEQFAELAADLTFAYQILENKSKTEEWDTLRGHAQDRLEVQRKRFPYLRAVGILLGRIYKYYAKYDQGVKVLSEVMEARTRKGMAKGLDYGALLYNRACYRTLAADVLDQNDFKLEAEALRNDAWDDLTESVHLVPRHQQAAKDDTDLTNLWNSERTVASLTAPARTDTASKKGFLKRLLRRGESQSRE